MENGNSENGNMTEEIMNTLDGMELWTDVFGDRICVGFCNPFVVVDGKKIRPTDEQVKQLLKEMMVQEFGTSDIHVLAKREGF